MKTMKKTIKKIKVVSKGLKEKKITLDKVSELLEKKHCPVHQPRSRGYQIVEYFLKHKPVENKVYNADTLLKNNTSSTNFVGSQTRNTLLKIFSQFKKIQGVEFKSNNRNLMKSLKFIK